MKSIYRNSKNNRNELMKTEFQSCRSNMRYMTEEKQGCPTEAEGKTFSPCKGNMQRA